MFRTCFGSQEQPVLPLHLSLSYVHAATTQRATNLRVPNFVIIRPTVDEHNCRPVLFAVDKGSQSRCCCCRSSSSRRGRRGHFQTRRRSNGSSASPRDTTRDLTDMAKSSRRSAAECNEASSESPSWLHPVCLDLWPPISRQKKLNNNNNRQIDRHNSSRHDLRKNR